MTEQEIRALDGPALADYALTLGLAPPGTRSMPQQGTLWYEDPQAQYRWTLWAPDTVLSQADQVFRHLRTLGFTTSCCFFADDRQHGDAWACLSGCAVSVQWPRDVASEAHALTLCACLAVASMQKKEPLSHQEERRK